LKFVRDKEDKNSITVIKCKFLNNKMYACSYSTFNYLRNNKEVKLLKPDVAARTPR